MIEDPRPSPRLSLPRAARWPAAVALLTLAAVAPATAQVPADSVLRDFQRTGKYRLYVAGKPVPKAEIYNSQRAGAMLVMTSSFESPVLLSPRSGTVESVNLMKVVKRADGAIDLLADATLAPLGGFRFDGEKIAFTAFGQTALLEPNPPLVGAHGRGELLSHSPEYEGSADLYQPDPQVVSALRRQPKTVKVQVFFGSWCPTCSRYLPYAIRLEKELGEANIGFEYYGVDTPPDGWKDPELKRLKINSVPTGIVFIGGREAGRFSTPAAWSQLESTLSGILQGRTASSGR